MNKEKILEVFYEITKHIAKDNVARYMRNHFSSEYKDLIESTKFLEKFNDPNDKNKKISIFERIYCIEHNLTDRPLCQKCLKHYVSGFNKQKLEYRNWCSPKCQAGDKTCISKAQQTKIEKYNDKNYNNKSKSKETRIKKYGKYHSDKFTDKLKQTKLIHFGDPNFVNPEKMKETKLKKYGDPNYTNRDKGRETQKRNFYRNFICKLDCEPLFSEDEYIQGFNKSTKNHQISVFKWKCKKCGHEFESSKSLSDSDETNSSLVNKINSAFLKFITSLGMKPISLDKLRDKQNYEEAKRDKLLVLDVPREVLNWYDDVKDKDRVPFEILVKAVNQWVGKAIKEEESEVLGSILMNIYKAYGINFAKGKGSWKKYKG